MTLPELSAALASRGLIAEDSLSIAPGPPGNISPWYVQVMMGACAWIAGLLLLAFMMVGLESVIFRGHEDWGVVLFLSICACASAAFLYARMGGNSSFGDQFALALSCAGQAGIAVSIGSMANERTALWAMILVEVALIFAMRSRLHRILSSFAAVMAWALATHEIFFRELPGIRWGAERAAVYQTSLLLVLLWLVVWVPIAYGAYRLAAGEARWMAEGRDALLRPVTHGLVASLAIAPLVSHPATFWMALGLGVSRNLTDGALGATALWPLLSMFLALLALALAFTLRSRSLMGLAMVFGLLEVSAFYYVLGTTLLIKSIIMLVMGGGLLASARWLAREAK